MKERKDVKYESGVLHAVGKVTYDLGKHETLIFSFLFPLLDLFFFLLVYSYIFGEGNHNVKSIIYEEPKKR